MTHYFARELASRPGISVEVHLPRAHRGLYSRPVPGLDVVHDLPHWRASFGRVPSRAISYWWPRADTAADLIHTLVEFPYAIVACKIARGRPFIVSGQGTYSVVPFDRPLDALLYRSALRRAAAVTAPSDFTARALSRRIGSDVAIEVLGNPVDTAVFRPSPETPGTSAGPMVLAVGALKARKGFDTLLRAMATVVTQEPDVRLVVVGGGETGDFEDLARQLGITERVEFRGMVERGDLVSLYQHASVFVLLPREVGGHFEGFGLVFLEAGACGTPVVAAASGGVADAVIDGETGFLVPPDEADAAAARIVLLLRDRQLAKRMGAAGRRHAEEHAWGRYVDSFVALYSGALAASGAR